MPKLIETGIRGIAKPTKMGPSIKRKVIFINSLDGTDLLEGSQLHIRIEAKGKQFKVGNTTYSGSIEAVLNPNFDEVISWIKSIKMVDKSEVKGNGSILSPTS